MTAGWRVEIAPPRDATCAGSPAGPDARFDALDHLSPIVTGDLIKLQGRTEHRLRVGAWRVILRLDDEARTAHVLRVLPRGRAYDR